MTRMAFTLLTLFSMGSAANTSLVLRAGEQKTIKLIKGGQVVITNPKVLKGILGTSSVDLVAKQAGLAQVKMGKTSYDIIVYDPKLEPLRTVLRPWLEKTFGISARIQPEKIFLEGKVYSLHDWERIQKLKKQFGKRLELDLNIAPKIIDDLRRRLDFILRERGLMFARTKVNSGHIELLSGTKDKNQRLALQEIAEDWGLSTPQYSEAVDLKPMVEIEIVIGEVKKEDLRELGLQMPGSYSATLVPAGDLSSMTTTFDGITPRLNALFTHSSNKVLANPKIICRSGEVAHFVAGGEIPIKLVNWKTSDVIWKKYGVILDITPVADFSNAISTKLVTEISLLDEAHTVDHIPGLLTNRIETHFDLRGSKTIALSGLIKSEMGRGTHGTPLLSEIPIIGELFKSNSYKDNKTELVVFVTPRVITPEDPPEPPKWPPGFQDDGV